MLNTKVLLTKGIDINDREYCQTAFELFNSRSFFILLEKFSNAIIKEKPEYYEFLNMYFNDEGYIDIWRIPHLLVDLVAGKCEYHAALLNDQAFRTKFMSFIGEFYNYCIKKTSLLLVESNNFTDYKSNMFHIRKNQYLYNLIVETYCKIYENLDSYGK
ncbi:hypothetical protein JOD02_000704 [Caldicoprobacter guelmensis]|uniref:hypothetical protein n=1 Tax=Caldicoprobacter guelmensis TaxID=1170224 RepID=UPI00195AC436|nr:hypothetical protein [Caldicoprobacter guelmensis]MBM7581867.1 hypothetical protein [Caldicoprobacter guelmensis]